MANKTNSTSLNLTDEVYWAYDDEFYNDTRSVFDFDEPVYIPNYEENIFDFNTTNKYQNQTNSTNMDTKDRLEDVLHEGNHAKHENKHKKHHKHHDEWKKDKGMFGPPGHYKKHHHKKDFDFDMSKMTMSEAKRLAHFWIAVVVIFTGIYSCCFYLLI